MGARCNTKEHSENPTNSIKYYKDHSQHILTVGWLSYHAGTMTFDLRNEWRRHRPIKKKKTFYYHSSKKRMPLIKTLTLHGNQVIQVPQTIYKRQWVPKNSLSKPFPLYLSPFPLPIQHIQYVCISSLVPATMHWLSYPHVWGYPLGTHWLHQRCFHHISIKCTLH